MDSDHLLTDDRHLRRPDDPSLAWSSRSAPSPFVGLLLIGGVVADRFPRRASMLGADLVRFVSEGLLAVLLRTGSPQLWVFIVLTGVLGAGQAFFNPA